jgi:hypothetical protein
LERQERRLKEEEEAAQELEKIKQKEAMDEAAKYIQKKWNWYQTEGRLLAKKKKKKKGGKKKKK